MGLVDLPPLTIFTCPKCNRPPTAIYQTALHSRLSHQVTVVCHHDGVPDSLVVEFTYAEVLAAKSQLEQRELVWSRVQRGIFGAWGGRQSEVAPILEEPPKSREDFTVIRAKRRSGAKW